MVKNIDMFQPTTPPLNPPVPPSKPSRASPSKISSASYPLPRLSSTSKRSALSGFQRAFFSTFSVFLSGRGLSLIQAPSKTNAQSVAIGFTQVGSHFYAWCATNNATAAAQGFTPQQTTGSWPRRAATHAPPQSHQGAGVLRLGANTFDPLVRGLPLTPVHFHQTQTIYY